MNIDVSPILSAVAELDRAIKADPTMTDEQYAVIRKRISDKHGWPIKSTLQQRRECMTLLASVFGVQR
jgi:hypothetical protein